VYFLFLLIELCALCLTPLYVIKVMEEWKLSLWYFHTQVPSRITVPAQMYFISASHFIFNHHDLWGSFIHRAFIRPPLSVNLPVEVGVYVSGGMEHNQCLDNRMDGPKTYFWPWICFLFNKCAGSQPSCMMLQFLNVGLLLLRFCMTDGWRIERQNSF